MNAPMTPERLAEIREDEALLVSDLGVRPQNPEPWFLAQGRAELLVTMFRRAAIDRSDLLAEVDRLQAVDHRCPSDHWPGRRRQQCHHWLGHDGNHANRFYRWSDEDRYPPPTSGDKVQS